MPVLVGSAAAYSQGHFKLVPFVAALLASLLIQTGTNLSNDYFDYASGADRETRLGPVRLIQSGIVRAQTVLLAALASFGAAVLVGLYLVYVGGPPILLIGLFSILAGLAYTGGPYPLGYNGLGDLAVFIFFGLVAVMGTFYLHAGYVDWLAFWVSIPVGLLVTNILVVNNFRDVETDRAAGKRTLAVRLGRERTRQEYLLFLIISYLIPVGLRVFGMESNWFWLPWMTLPLAIAALRDMSGRGGPLNSTLKKTGQLHLTFGFLLSLSLLL